MLSVNNQKPIILNPIYTGTAIGPYDLDRLVSELILDPIYRSPIDSNYQVSITYNNDLVDYATITNHLMLCCHNVFQSDSQDFIRALLEQALVYFPKNSFDSLIELYSCQSSIRANLPQPSINSPYTIDKNIKPSCLNYLNNKFGHDTAFVSFTQVFHPNTLAFSFYDDTDYNMFKSWLSSTAVLCAGNGMYDNDCLKTLNSFIENTDLEGLTESIRIRDDDAHNNQDGSFARVLIAYLMQYSNMDSNRCKIMPFSLMELICPLSVVFINISKHANSSTKAIREEWDIIKESLADPIKVMSNQEIQKLTTSVRAMRNLSNYKNNFNQATFEFEKQALIPFSKTLPKNNDVHKRILNLLKRMQDVSVSENIYKYSRKTYSKANRRDPDDFNAKGRIYGNKCKPDLHIYLDTSGSISAQNYQDTIKVLICIAKKLNINFYFNSFSHYMSESTKLMLKDKNYNAIYLEFERIPKVSGGTCFNQIWQYINDSPVRRSQLSIIISDMEYVAPNQYIIHPKNLYYLPCANMPYDRIVSSTEDLIKSMLHNNRNIRKQFLY